MKASLTQGLKSFVASWNSPTRARSALGLGLVFTLLIFPIYVIRSDVTTILGVIVGAYSPIYLWRFWHCTALNSYYDPIWRFNAEAIIPFLFYGAAIGYFLNRPPKLSLKYAGVVAVCFLATLIVVLNIMPMSDSPNPLCETGFSHQFRAV